MKVVKIMNVIEHPSSSAEADDSYQFGEFVLTQGPLRLRRRGAQIGDIAECGIMDLKVLRVFLDNPGKVLRGEEILRMARATELKTNRIPKSISVLRRALGDDPYDSSYIETVPKSGYRFVRDVTPPVGLDAVSCVRDQPSKTEREQSSVRRRTLICSGLAACILVGVVVTFQPQTSVKDTQSPRFEAVGAFESDVVEAGTPAMATVAVTNLASHPVSGAMIKIEAYDDQIRQVFNQAWPAVRFEKGESRAFSIQATLPRGRVRLAAGIFPQGSDKAYLWEENVQTIQVK